VPLVSLLKSGAQKPLWSSRQSLWISDIESLKGVQLFFHCGVFRLKEIRGVLVESLFKYRTCNECGGVLGAPQACPEDRGSGRKCTQCITQSTSKRPRCMWWIAIYVEFTGIFSTQAGNCLETE
jgi:hypothetical protein